ncbi:MAG: hypothetical protein AABZ01_14220, partial [Gemmatimonadota bacterium]
MTRWVLLVGSALLVLGAVPTLWIRSRLSTSYLESIFNHALTPASEGLYRVSLDRLEVQVLRGNLQLHGLRLHLRPGAVDSLAALGLLPAVRFEGDMPEVVIEGVRLLRLVRHGDLEADRLVIPDPRLTVRITPRPDAGLDEDAVVQGTGWGDSTRAHRPTIVLPEGTPRVRLGLVTITHVDADLVIEGDTADLATVESTAVEALDVTLERLVLDPAEPIMADRVLFSDDARVAFRQFDLVLTTGAKITIGPAATSSRDGVLTIERVILDPGETEAAYLARPRASEDLIAVRTGQVRLEGIDYSGLVQNFQGRISRGTLDSLQVEITSDKQKIKVVRTSPGFMPHTVFRELPLGVTVDSFIVTNGMLRYRERGARSNRLGEVSFDPLNATMTNVTNNRTRMTRQTPAVVEVRTRLFGVAPISATIRVPLLARGPNMDLVARVGGFDAKLVNRMVRSLEGVEITSGEIDEARISIQYRPGRATGGVTVIYRDLGVRLEDARSREQNFGQRLLSIAANTMLRGSNDPQPGKAPRVG